MRRFLRRAALAALAAAAAAALLAGSQRWGPWGAAHAVPLVVPIRMDFGWSGIEVSEDGGLVWLISDRAAWAEGRLVRAADGTLSRVAIYRHGRLRAPDGTPMVEPYQDTEGLALHGDGSFTVSREWQHGVSHFADLGGPTDRLAPEPVFVPLGGNAGLEAVALDAAGRLHTLAERPTGIVGPHRLYVQEAAGGWQVAARLARRGLWSAVGADFGPDGRFYLLERRFAGLGFAARIRRFDLPGGAEPLRGTVVYRAPLGRHGNLEGLALWAGPDNTLRAVMVSDDNGLSLQRSEIVEIGLGPLVARAPDR